MDLYGLHGNMTHGIYFSYTGSYATAPWNLGVLIHIKNEKLKKQPKSISNIAISFGWALNCVENILLPL